MISNKLFFSIILVALVGCKAKKPLADQAGAAAATTAPQKYVYTPAEGVTTNINFANFEITKNSRQEKTNITLGNTSAVRGRLKPKGEQPAYGDYLEAEIYEGGKLSETLRLQHPLFFSQEAVDDNNQFKRSDVALKKADFNIRFQSAGTGALTVKLFEKLKDSPRVEVASLNL